MAYGKVMVQKSRAQSRKAVDKLAALVKRYRKRAKIGCTRDLCTDNDRTVTARQQHQKKSKYSNRKHAGGEGTNLFTCSNSTTVLSWTYSSAQTKAN